MGIIAGAASANAQSISLPGTIQAEDFDQGPANVAYRDLSVGNSGGEYRATDVDIEACDEGGFNISYVEVGEWLKYTVNVAQAGAYTLEFRVASKHAGGIFHLEMNGTDKTGPISIPDTDSWQAWTTVTKSGVNLSAGSQAWRVVFDDDGQAGAVGNLNYVRVSGPTASSAASTPYSGTPAAIPGTVQLEDYDKGGEGIAYHDLSVGNEGGQYRSDGVDIELSFDAGGGYSIGYALAQEWLAYKVNVVSAGTYNVELRVASKGAGGTFHIEVNGVNKTGSFTVPDTGGWQNWVTIRKTGLTLSQGQQVLKLVMDSDGAAGAVGNFNYMRFNLEASSGGGPSSTPYGGAAAALPGKLQLEAFDNGGEGVAYHDLSVENLGGAYRSTGVDIETTTDSGGGYNIGWVYAGEWLAYTVNVGAAGTYDIEARVSSPGAGGTFHIEIDGVDRTGALSVPNTGGWQQWTTIRKAGVSLNAGLQVWRVVIDSNGSTNAMGNLNYLSVLSSSGSGTSNPPPPVTQPSSLSDRDIGDPQLAGSTTAANGRFTVTGSGQDIWDAFDQFHFAYQQLQGDMEVIARVDSLQGPDEWSKGGVMIRESLAATARNVLVAATIAKGWTFQRRIDEGGNTLPSDGLRPSGTAPGWVKLVRQGDVFTGYYSPDGSAWVRINSDTIPMSSTVYVGMAVTAHNDGERATAAFSNFVVQGVSASGNGNQPPTVWVSNPANGTSYTSPASLTINATASDNDGNIARVDFYASGTLIGSDTSNPYSFNWTGVGSGTYSLTAVARDDDGATTTSSAVGVTVLGTTTNIPTTLVFTPSADHITLVTSYSVALYRSGTSVTSTPVASKNLGKPSLVNNEISVSISDIVNPLPSGTYYAVVTAVGSGGSASSSPSASFTK